MVTCKLKGGLGNQLFQIAATIGYSKLHNMPFYLPPATIDPKYPYYIDYLPQLPSGSHPEGTIMYTDPSYYYTPIAFHPDICLVCDDSTRGYFQSEKYFDHCRPDIIRAFNIPCMMRTGAISVHVRRGDYLDVPAMHPVISELYLQRSICFFYERGFRLFVFFSDDITWCRRFVETIKNIYPAQYEFSEKKPPMGDMAEMASCEHNIIANSTFSWWAAWLNHNPDKIVIAPKRWYGPDMLPFSTKDLLPERWLKIDC